MSFARALVFVLLCVLGTGAALGVDASSRELPAGVQVPDAAKPGPAFDVDRATQAYLDLLTPEQRAQSDAYFEGGYWLDFFGLLYGLGVAAVLLLTGLSVRMRELARKVSPRPWPTTLIYVALWILAGFVLGLPFASYSGYFREHAYGLSTQTYPQWLGEHLIGLGVTLLLGTPAIATIYAAVRRTRGSWWAWAGGIAFAFTLFYTMIAPVFVAPLFNTYKPVPDGPVREAVLSLARANQIPTENVMYFDASRQTTRVSANVSGFAGTTRVSLNDNLLDRTSLPEIKAVMGHEMGHYVLNHSLRGAIYFSLLLTLGFMLAHFAMDRALARWGTRLRLEGRADPAALPLFIAIFSLYSFLAGPAFNSITRQAEAEADAFGLNAAREPHGFATVAMRLSTYRKIHPTELEEVIFYDHPSGYARVHRAMQWLKENPTATAEEPRADVAGAP
jgi:STE24 endopeptidase